MTGYLHFRAASVGAGLLEPLALSSQAGIQGCFISSQGCAGPKPLQPHTLQAAEGPRDGPYTHVTDGLDLGRPWKHSLPGM